MKKRTVFTLLAASTILLSSCDVAVANIKNPSDPFANINGSDIKVDSNTLQNIYDIVKEDGNFKSDIKTLLNVEIAKNYLGNFTMDKDGNIKLEGWDYALDSDGKTISVTDDDKLTFVKQHKAYWNWKDAGIKVTYEDIDDIKKENLEEYNNRINELKTIVKKQVVVTMFNNINSDSYKYNNRFYEVLYIKGLVDNLNTIYKIDGTPFTLSEIYVAYDELEDLDYEVTTTESNDGEFSQGISIDNRFEPNKDIENIISGDTPLLHIEHYYEFINMTIMPTIMTNLLTEQYILENQYAAIGRTQQRLIEFIKIEDNTQKNAYNLLRNYGSSYLSSMSKDDSLNLDIVAKAWMGIPSDLNNEDNAKSKEIAQKTFGNITGEWQNKQVLIPKKDGTPLEALEKDDADYENNFTLVDGKKVYAPTYIDGHAYDYYKYYKNSEFGDLIRDYSTLTTNPDTNNIANYESFTNMNGKIYTPEKGLEIKTEKIRVQDYTTYGWGTKTDYSSLPSDVQDQLFSYGLVSEFDQLETTTEKADGRYLKTFTPGGITFLKKKTYDLFDPYDSIIWESDGNYYLIAVYDYISPSKTTSDGESTQEEMKVIENYAREVGYKIASGTTYTSDALEYYVENADLVYFDQEVYNYFEEQFPDLFK